VDSSVSGDVGDARLAADWTILPTIVASNAAARSGSATVQRNGTGTRAVRMRVGTEGHAASVRSGAGTFASNTVRAFLGRTELCCGQACFEGTIAATALASSIDQHAARHGDHGARYDCFDATEIVLARRPHSTFWVNEDPRCKAIPVTTCRAATLSALELSGA
jgi:hypothetical protein